MREVYGIEYQTLSVIGGGTIEIPMAPHKSRLRMPCELFWCNKADQTFGVRYTNGDEKVVEDTPENRRYYSETIEMYREELDKVMKP